MRPIVQLLSATLFLLAALPAQSADLRNFDDAALNAVQFVDDQEGWAVGEDGVIWHTIDGGKNWERQPSGVRASLRSLHFLDPFTGWVVGREELPGGGSAGIVLYTTDGGLKWRRLLVNAMPGLHVVRFVDAKVGYMAGEGADTYPSGLFITSDAGRNWQPVAGPRTTAWMAGEFNSAGGSLAGAWNRLATVRKNKLNVNDELESLGGRALRGLYFHGQHGVAVGQGGLVLTTETAGVSWSFTNLKLAANVTANLDFHGIHGAGNKLWVIGRPGSCVLHSPDGGSKWRLQKTPQSMPLNGVFFRDEQRGWAVGELGTIITTSDGGQTWTLQHNGGERTAVLMIHARATGTPMDTVALLGAREGYLTAGLRVTGPDVATAPLARACDAARYAAALRLAGGAAGEMLWQFPLPTQVVHGDRDEVVKAWDGLHDDHAAEQMLRQLTLALRMWRPDVVITDSEASPPGAPVADALIGEAAHEAFRKAGDPSAFPEQIGSLGLQAWKPTKLYGLDRAGGTSHVSLDLTSLCPLLEATVAEFAAAPAALLAETAVALPAQRHFRLVESTLADAASHKDLFQGIDLAPGGLARRALPPPSEIAPEVAKAIRQRATLRAFAEMPPNRLIDPNQLLAQIGPMLADMPDDHAARAMHAVASQFARAGQWGLAREAYLLMVDRYPAHPLALEAYRWLVRHTSSSEARRRHELGHFLVLQQAEFGMALPTSGAPKGSSGVQTDHRPVPDGDGVSPADPKKPAAQNKPRSASSGKATKNPTAAKSENGPRPEPTPTEDRLQQTSMVLASKAEARKWYQGALEIEPRLEAFGPLFANDPSIQFCLASARRNLGDFEAAKSWFQDFASRQPEGPWRSAAKAELWLANRVGPPPKPIAFARQTAMRPYLDGKLDDPCWQSAAPLKLKAVGGNGLAEYAAEVKLAYDQEYLYVALRCSHPAGRQVPLTKSRQHDADLSRYDRVSLSFDLDRDYSTSFNFHIDQRGCVRDDCWGDKTWDPRWFVAVQSSASGWHAECAIPLTALTGDNITVGRTWAFNAVRVIPAMGVQAWSLPADGEATRPEGMGLLMFISDGPQSAALPRSESMPRLP